MKMALRSNLSSFLIGSFLSISVVFSLPAMAQSGDIATLQNQIQSLRAAISDLQLKVFKGEMPESISPVGGGALGAAPSTEQLGMVQGQVLELEESLRDLNGQYEVLDNRASRIETRLDKLIEDIDFRLTALENANAGVAQSGNGQNLAQNPSASSAQVSPNATSAPQTGAATG
ncbi:MAG: hypothetical protein R3261_07990, partial [Alphaproteobacteria bacterium]|nr:hypothetical protein [Alphaproteobacteria bacterium]